jgi:hypothetical protein
MLRNVQNAVLALGIVVTTCATALAEDNYPSRIIQIINPVWSKYWSEASISSIENLIALITVPVPHRRPG